MKGIKQVRNYRLLKEIGRGTTGIVYEAVDDSTGKKYAIKAIPSSKLENRRIMDNFKRELKVLYGLSHQNIIKITGIEKTVNNTYLALEYCNGGNLYEYLNFHKRKFGKPLSEEMVQFVIRQIISGLEYMHNHNIVHRDIKLENILLNFNSVSNTLAPNQDSIKLDYNKVDFFDCTIKIADLGYARELDTTSLASTICGTPMTMAPDVIQMGDKKYNSKADLWSLGAITYELVTGTLPFYGNNFNNLMENVIKGKYSFPKNLSISLECIVFINGLLQFYPQKRYNWTQITSHPFIMHPTSNFTIVNLEQVELDQNSCIQLQNDTKDCGNFLWVLFKSSLKTITLDKVGLQNFLLGEVDGFKKILNINKENERKMKEESLLNESRPNNNNEKGEKNPLDSAKENEEKKQSEEKEDLLSKLIPEKEVKHEGDEDENDKWELLSCDSIFNDKIEVINVDEEYKIIDDYFINK